MFESFVEKLSQVALELRTTSELIRLVREHIWFLPLMSILALISSTFEGISLALLIPLIEALDGAAAGQSGNRFVDFLVHGVSHIPIGSRLLAVLAAMTAAVLMKGAISYANMVVLAVFYGRLSHSLRIGVFERMLARPLSEIERDQSGRLLNVLSNETWRATDAINCLFTAITSFFTICVLLTLLIILSWQLSLIAIFCTAVIPPLLYLITRRVKYLSQIGLAANETLSRHTWSALNGLRMIHSFGREQFVLKRFTESSDRVRDLFFRMALVSMTTGPITEVLVVGVLGLLAIIMHASAVSVGTLVGFLAILFRLQPRLFSIVSAQANLLGLHGSLSAVSEALATPVCCHNVEGKRRFELLRDRVSFDNVTFTYEGALRPALANVSFDLRRGTIVAIVGSSGAGKSTLLDLLLGFQSPQCGTIRVDGVPLDEIALDSWRSHLGIVSQDPYIFDDTVRANIQFGRAGATEEQMMQAAKLACADAFIHDLPTGYDTVIGERGAQISGGQRQRVALARALIREPDILLLDEATNALDTMTEQAFQRALMQFAKTRTVIIIAHRPSSIDMADEVLVLEGGRVMAQGQPHALIGK